MSLAVAANFAPFNPDSRGPNSPADAILADIAAAEKSLRQLAADHGTTLPALALWLESAQAQDRMAELSAGLAAATRLAALAHTHSAVAALDELITDYRAERIATAAATAAAPSKPAPDPSDPSTLRERMLAERRRGNIIRAATTLLRLTRIPGAAPSTRPRAHTAAPKQHDPRPHEPMPRAPMHHAMMPLAPQSATTAPAPIAPVPSAPPRAVLPQTPPHIPAPPPSPTSPPESPALTLPSPTPYIPPHPMHGYKACRNQHAAELSRLNRMAPAAKPRTAQHRAPRTPSSPPRPALFLSAFPPAATLLAAAGSAGPSPGPAP